MECPNCATLLMPFAYVGARFYSCECGYTARYNQHLDSRTFEPLESWYLANESNPWNSL